MTERGEYLELADLQDAIKDRIGYLEHWVRVEIESHRVVNGHHYLNLIQKSPGGSLVARASGRIWRSRSGIVDDFTFKTGQGLDAGISVLVHVCADYNAVYGLTLIINEIDYGYTVGLRELERQRTISRLTESGLMERQGSLPLPFLPSSVAVISSSGAAGYGDFVKHLEENSYGYRINCTLLQALMQGESAPASISGRIIEACRSGLYDVIVILRGGGSEADLFCYDDFGLAKAIAEAEIPVLTAIGHERDYHVADMVSYAWFKTPTALSDALIDWVHGVEAGMEDAFDAVRDALVERILFEEKMVSDLCSSTMYHLADKVNSIRRDLTLTLNSIVSSCSLKIQEMVSAVERLLGSVQLSDPRSILSQGYVLAVDRGGGVLKSVRSASEGDSFVLRFKDGRWECRIDNVLEDE